MKLALLLLLAASATALAQCPVQIEMSNPRSGVLAIFNGADGREHDPWNQYLAVRFRNNGAKEIVAVQFAASFGDVLNAPQPSTYAYNWYGKVKPGKSGIGGWGDGVYVHAMAHPQVDVHAVKIAYKDGTTELCK